MSGRSRPRRIVAGEYGINGYSVLLCSGARVHTLYTAGNHPLDSQVVTPRGIGLRRIRGFCIRTCRELAEEHYALFGGVTFHSVNAGDPN